jgi:hypothetical protein
MAEMLGSGDGGQLILVGALEAGWRCLWWVVVGRSLEMVDFEAVGEWKGKTGRGGSNVGPEAGRYA